jgi:hypothetical protein
MFRGGGGVSYLSGILCYPHNTLNLLRNLYKSGKLKSCTAIFHFKIPTATAIRQRKKYELDSTQPLLPWIRVVPARAIICDSNGHRSSITYLLTPWSRVVLEKQAVNFAVCQEIPRIYGTQKFLTVPTSARHLRVSCAKPIQSPRPSPSSVSIYLAFI